MLPIVLLMYTHLMDFNNVYSCIKHNYIEHNVYLVSQLCSNSDTTPLLAPNRLLHHDGKTVIYVDNNEEGRSLVNWYMSNYGNR